MIMDFTNRSYILLDLDGTLVDSQEGILNSVRYAVEKLGLQRPEYEVLRRFIGPSLRTSFMEQLGLSEEKASEAVSFYREFYSTVGILQCIAYPGMEELLRTLTTQGKHCALATVKPHIFAERVLVNLGLDQYFTAISGTTLEAHSNDKSTLLEYAMEQMGVMDKSKAVMIGDTSYDCIGAKKAGVDCIGILHGIGDEPSLRESGASAIVADTQALHRLLCDVSGDAQ